MSKIIIEQNITFEEAQRIAEKNGKVLIAIENLENKTILLVV